MRGAYIILIILFLLLVYNLNISSDNGETNINKNDGKELGEYVNIFKKKVPPIEKSVDEKSVDEKSVDEKSLDEKFPKKENYLDPFKKERKQKKPVEFDAQGAFQHNYYSNGLIYNKDITDGGSISDPPRTTPDFITNVDLLDKKFDTIKEIDTHYIPNASLSKADVRDGEGAEKFKNARIGISTIRNAQQNSYKKNVDINKGPPLIKYNNSKKLNWNYSANVIEYSNPIDLNVGNDYSRLETRKIKNFPDQEINTIKSEIITNKIK